MMDAIGQIYKFEGMPGLFRSFPITLLTNLYGAVMVSINEVLKQRILQHWWKGTIGCIDLLNGIQHAGMVAAATTTPLDRVKDIFADATVATSVQSRSCPQFLTGRPPIATWTRALSIILEKEGATAYSKEWHHASLHISAVAISWTTYETVKMWLANHHS